MISLSKMKEWFSQETESSVKRVRFEIQKRIDNINMNLQELKIAAQDFEVKDTIDAESRSSQNIYEKMTEMVDNFKIPEKVTYKTADEFLKDLEKFLSRVLTLGNRFIRNLMKSKYKTRVFILNRALSRIQKNYQEFKKFLDDKTVLLQDVDSTSDNIELLLEKVKEREELKKKVSQEKEYLTTIENQIVELDKSTIDLKSGTVIQDLEEVKKEIQIIGNKLKLELGGLDKPLRNLLARAQDGKVMVPLHIIDWTNLLKENTIEAFEGLEKGQQKLNDLMNILLEAMEGDKLKLKASMQNKAKELAHTIMNGAIINLHEELLVLVEKRNELEQSVEKLGLKDKITEIELKHNVLAKDKDRTRRGLNDFEEKLELLNNEIVELAADTQRRVRKIINQDIKINIKD